MDGCDCPAPYGRIMPGDPPPSPRAADLPEGSVVATATIVWMMVHPGSDAPWRSTGSLARRVNDERVQHELDTGRATVLRVGTGQEGP